MKKTTRSQDALLTRSRRELHKRLIKDGILRLDKEGFASNADKHNKASVAIARGIAEKIGVQRKDQKKLAGQSSGAKFELACKYFLEQTFCKLEHLRPGMWAVEQGSTRSQIAGYEQYSHLSVLKKAAENSPELAAVLSDYTITPDLVIYRSPVEDEILNSEYPLVDEKYTKMTSLRKSNNPQPLLHASISCKWTMRSDRAQNTRTEALNLIRNRKGRVPHVVAVTGEPLPSRIASIAIGTGDIDCTYHFALHELQDTLNELNYEDAKELLEVMIEGKRLKDMSDLPLELTI